MRAAKLFSSGGGNLCLDFLVPMLCRRKAAPLDGPPPRGLVRDSMARGSEVA
jgi:hypothetical protein